ncbi:type II and III secretion system protein family protein [Methylobacillus gramineus]|uniref:type II and III secretion system protein family protein n=1 Tax=Methylobacillus gramineus TaxID=755169 RepID=UPI001CFFF028|nr:type II and III secretion system protein family protein [Methylobacillus gramineus]MCB5184479.1 type II and III secretion system protein family protein [Methylobacillus gramineus]
MTAFNLRERGIGHFSWLFGMSLCLLGQGACAEEINLSLGQQKLYEHPVVLQRVAVVNPEVVAVTLINPKTLMMIPKAVGATEISLWDGNTTQPGRVLHITVAPSSAVEAQGLNAAQAGDLQVEAAGNGLALVGEAKSLEEHARAVESLQKDRKGVLDVSSSGFDSHVQIDIKVVEVSRQNAMRFGFLMGRNSRSHEGFGVVSPPGTLSGVENTDSGFNFSSGSGFLPVLNAFNLVLGNHGSGLLGTISVLETNGFAYTLAEPSLSAISGQTATFLAGGEFPVPIRTGGGSDSAITIRYKEYGVRLMLTPTILSGERIFLKVAPEVSELDFANAVQTGGVSVPGLKVRRTETSVSLGNGESFVISGMVSRNTVNNIDKMPWLGNIPIIGAFFSSKRFDREDKELLMVVTPRLVRPIARNAALPELPGKELKDYKPSFSEFFLSREAYPKSSSTGMSR